MAVMRLCHKKLGKLLEHFITGEFSAAQFHMPQYPLIGKFTKRCSAGPVLSWSQSAGKATSTRPSKRL
jgi:hypothetical protein